MVAFLAALPAFIASLPYIFQVLVKMMGIFERFVTWAQSNNFQERLNEIEDCIDALEKAETVEQKRSAARGVVDLIRKL